MGMIKKEEIREGRTQRERLFALTAWKTTIGRTSGRPTYSQTTMLRKVTIFSFVTSAAINFNLEAGAQ